MDRARTGQQRNVVELPPAPSQCLLEKLATPCAFDQHPPLSSPPRDGPDDQRLAGEGPEALPHRRLKGMGQLVTERALRDVDTLVAVKATDHDRADLAATAGTPAKRNRGDRGAEPSELGPHRLAVQLVAPRR